MPSDSDSSPDYGFPEEFPPEIWKASPIRENAGEADHATLQRIRTEMEGYLELGMTDFAEEELNALPQELADQPLILDARLSLLMQTRRWPEAVETGLRGCAAAPLSPAFFIHTAFCLHELGRTGEAHRLLTAGPRALEKEPLYHYNIACYLAVLGRLQEARPNLSRAFRLDPSLKKFAGTDRDLELLWPDLSEF